MVFGKFERYLLDGEFWSIWQQTKLPEHLQLLVDNEQIKRDDIWELPSKEQVKKPNHPSCDDDHSHSTTI